MSRALADALLVTGQGTGFAVDLAKLSDVRRAVPEATLLVASGATAGAQTTLAGACDGVIVGSALRASGIAGGAIDVARAASFAAAFRAAFAY